jgi:hypothetical protein
MNRELVVKPDGSGFADYVSVLVSIFNLFIFCDASDGTQGLIHAGQTCYH